MPDSLLSCSNLAILLLLYMPKGCVAQELDTSNSIWWAPYLQLASLSDIDRVYAESSVVAKANESRARHESWEQFDPQMKVVSRKDQDLQIQDDDDSWHLTIVVPGDFNHDGLEDEVVIACDSKRFGSGGLCLPLVLTASSPDNVMTLISSLSEPYKISASSTGTR
ncbi:MAG: hypothetical protein JO061_10710 [Acidobacteriaceae bacterium]|nr:hypothetical protein [Acidobacteriaceae bacterium]